MRPDGYCHRAWKSVKGLISKNLATDSCSCLQIVHCAHLGKAALEAFVLLFQLSAVIAAHSVAHSKSFARGFCRAICSLAKAKDGCVAVRP